MFVDAAELTMQSFFVKQRGLQVAESQPAATLLLFAILSSVTLAGRVFFFFLYMGAAASASSQLVMHINLPYTICALFCHFIFLPPTFLKFPLATVTIFVCLTYAHLSNTSGFASIESVIIDRLD